MRQTAHQQRRTVGSDGATNIGSNMSTSTASYVAEPGVASVTRTTTKTTTNAPLPESERVSTEKWYHYMWERATTAQLWGTRVSIFVLEFLLAWFYYFGSGMEIQTGMSNFFLSVVEGGLIYICLAIGLRGCAGHVDPLITGLLLVEGKMGPLTWDFSIVYWLAQTCGAILATLMMWAFAPGNDRSLGLGTIGPVEPGYTPGQAMGLEMFMTFFQYLFLLILINSENEINFFEAVDRKKSHLSLPAIMGITRGLIVAIAVTVSGGNLNWYRYFFDAVISGTVSSSNWWVAFIGPPLGWLAALATYHIYHWLAGIGYGPLRVGPPAYILRMKELREEEESMARLEKMELEKNE